MQQKTETVADSIIEAACSRAAGEQAQRFGRLFADCAARAPDAREVLILSGFLPLLAMSLARLPQNVQRGYALSFTRRVNAAFGEGGGMTFPTRTLEYLAAFKQDVTSGKGDALPALLSAALTHVCGGRDEGAERCRSGLLQALLSTLQSDVQHFGGVRFSSH